MANKGAFFTSAQQKKQKILAESVKAPSKQATDSAAIAAPKSAEGYAAGYRVGSLSNSVKTYISNFNGDMDHSPWYQKGFDAASFFEERRKEAEAIRAEAADAERYFNRNWNVYTPEGMDHFKKFHSDINSIVDDILGRYESINTGMAENPDAFAYYQKEYQMRTADLDVLQKELDELNAQYDNYQYDASTFRGRMAADADLQRMEKEISDRQQYLNQARRIQDGVRMASASQNADFGQKSGYQAGITDPVYEYVNDVNGARRFMDRSHNPAIKAAYDQMTEEEIANYNYYYATGGQEQAQRYLDTLAETLNQRKGEQMSDGIKGQTAKELLFAAGAGLNQAAEGFRNLFSNEDYIAPSAYQYASGMVREDLADNGMHLPQWMGGASVGQVAYDLVNTGANMLPSMAVGAINPVAGAALMGASAAGNAYQEALNSGYSKEQARVYSALVGGSEAGLEYLLGGISSLGGIIPEGVISKILSGVDNAFWRFAIQMGGSMVSEGFEEGLQDVLTPYFKNLALMADEKVNWNDAAYSTLLGALSVLPMEGPGAAVDAISGSRSGSSGSGSAPLQVSNSGNTFQISTQKNVEALDFDGIDEKGNATIQLTDSTTADMNDIMFGTEGEAMQYRTVASLPGIDTENANTALHYLKDNGGAEDTQSAVGVRDAYSLGYYGMDMNVGADAKNIPSKLAQTMYDIGKAQRTADTLKTGTVTAQNKSATPAKGYKKVVFEGNVKVGKNQEASVKMMNYIADNFSGNTVRVYQSYVKNGKRYFRDSNGTERSAPNGRYVGNEIWVDLNAGNKGEGLMLNTFAHEMYHHIETWNKKGAQELADFLVREIGGDKVEKAVQDQIRKARSAGYGEKFYTGQGYTEQQARNMVYDKAMSDFVADSLETMFSKGDPAAALAKLRGENLTLYEEIKKFVNEWVTKLREFLGDKTVTAEGRMVAQLEKFEQIQQKFMEAMDTAGQNYTAAVEGRRNRDSGKIVDEIQKVIPRTEAEISETQVEQATTDVEAVGQFSLRNEKKGNTIRDVLSRVDPESRKSGPEKYYLTKYREDRKMLAEEEAKLATVKAKMEGLGKGKELENLKKQERSLKQNIATLRNSIKAAEQSSMFRRIVAEQRLADYKEEQKQLMDAQAEEFRQLRKELTGADSVISVMEDEFVTLAKKYEAKEIDLKTMETEFMRLAKAYEKDAGQAEQLKDDNAIWQREFKRLMKEYDAADRKIERLESTVLRQRQRAKEKVLSRHNTELRGKIERKYGQLDKMLRKGSKTSYVPEYLREPVSKILDAIDLRKSDKKTKISDHLLRLKNEYRKIKNDADPNISSIYDEGLSDYLDILTEKVGNTKLGDMNRAQLEAVYDILTAVLETTRNANKAFIEGRNQEISELSKSALWQVKSEGGEKYKGKSQTMIGKALRNFMWNDMRPIDIFEAIGSGEMMNLFRNVRKGEDTWAKDIAEARDFFHKQWTKYNGKKWDMEQTHTFQTSSGVEFKLNLEQIMSIYALFRRDKSQAMDHLRKGGFVFDNNVVDSKGRTHSDATAYNLSDQTILKIIGTLNQGQMRFVESMQGYLSDVMGAKGNEVSMAMYGIKLFREKNYFPLRTAIQYMERAKAQQRGDVKIKNSGFTKPVTPGASTPIVLTPFLSVWGSHVDEMSNYHAFVLPIEDFYRVYNYRTDIGNDKASSKSVQAAIQNAYGEGAVKAIDQLLKDINGGVRADSTASAINTMISRYKKGATMASLSVVVQQPSSILRAASMIDAKYFIGPKMTSQYADKTWDEIKKFAPIAIIKEMGGFDTNTGRAASEYITGQEYDGFEQKFQAFFKDGKFRDDMLGRLPALADEIGWSAIWNAVKREQKDAHPNMNMNSDAFMNLVADRFTDVIVHTQVYDSVMARSAMMRSKDTGMKMITSFMAEPTVIANMVTSAMTNAARKGDKKGAVRTISAVLASTVVNIAAASLVYAMRDDDEEERFDEKWIASFRTNLVDSVNPMGYIPLLRDVSNLMKGYDIERADMSIVSDLVDAWKGFQSEKLTGWDKAEKGIGAVMNVFGLPVKNVLRDAKGIYNTLRQAFGVSNPSTKTGRQIAWSAKTLDDGDQLLLAIQNGDTAHFERVASRFKNRQKADAALQSAIRKQYISEELDTESARELLETYFDREDEDEIYWILQEWDYAKSKGTGEGFTKMGSLMEAIESGDGLDEEIQRYEDNGVDISTIRSQISKVYRKKYLEADDSGRESIRNTVERAYLATGMRDADIQEKFNDWDFEVEYGMTYDDMTAEYKAVYVTELAMRDAMKFYGLKNYDIEERMTDMNEDVNFQKKYGSSLSEMWDGYDDGDITRNQMVNALVFTGKTKEEATETVTQRDIRNRLGIEYAKLDDAYKYGDISRSTLYNAMIKNGATKDEADEAIVGYDWLKKNVRKHPDLTISDAKKFAVSIGENAKDHTLDDYGVSIDAYQNYKAKIGQCKGIDRNGDGVTDSGTLRDSVFAMIDSLNISDEAKTGLALMKYSKNNIRKNAPWAK